MRIGLVLNTAFLHRHRFLGVLCLIFVAGCSSSKPRAPLSNEHNSVQTVSFSLEQPPSLPALARGETRAPNADEFGEQLSDYGHTWFFGSGVGKTMANVGTIIVFPPYAIYLLGNAGLQLAGYQPIHVSEEIPGQAGTYVRGAYEGVTSLPGRVTSLLAGLLAGQEFVEPNVQTKSKISEPYQ